MGDLGVISCVLIVTFHRGRLKENHPHGGPFIDVMKEGRKEMFYLTIHVTHFNTVIWRRTYVKIPFI